MKCPKCGSEMTTAVSMGAGMTLDKTAWCLKCGEKVKGKWIYGSNGKVIGYEEKVKY